MGAATCWRWMKVSNETYKNRVAYMIRLHTLVAELLARPAISAQVFLGFRVSKTNAEMVSKTPSFYCMLLI